MKFRGVRRDIKRGLKPDPLNPNFDVRKVGFPKYMKAYFLYGRYKRLLHFSILAVLIFLFPFAAYCVRNYCSWIQPKPKDIAPQIESRMGPNQTIFRLLADIIVFSPDENTLSQIDYVIQNTQRLRNEIYALKYLLGDNKFPVKCSKNSVKHLYCSCISPFSTASDSVHVPSEKVCFQEFPKGVDNRSDYSHYNKSESPFDDMNLTLNDFYNDNFDCSCNSVLSTAPEPVYSLPEWENVLRLLKNLDKQISGLRSNYHVDTDLKKLKIILKKRSAKKTSIDNILGYSNCVLTEFVDDNAVSSNKIEANEQQRLQSLAEHVEFIRRKESEALFLINDLLVVNKESNKESAINKLLYEEDFIKSSNLEYAALFLRDWSPGLSSLLALLILFYWHRIWVGRQHASGRGRTRTFFVLIVFSSLMFYNIVLINAYQPNITIVDESARPSLTDFSVEEYKTAVKEIEYRLEQEQDFYILKFTMIGALLAVFFRFLLTHDPKESPDSVTKARSAVDRLRESKIAALFFWAAVIVNCILDTRLRYNSIYCSSLGDWIATLETSVDTSKLPGWETFLNAQAFSTSPFMQIAPSLLTAIVFAFTVLLFMVQKENVTIRGNVNERLKGLNLWFGSMTFLLLAFSGLGDPGMQWEWFAPVTVWAFVGILVLHKGPKSLSRRVFMGDEINESLVGHAFPFHYLEFFEIPARWRLWTYIWPTVKMRDKIVAKFDTSNDYRYLEMSREPIDVSAIYRRLLKCSDDVSWNDIWTVLYLVTSQERFAQIKKHAPEIKNIDESEKRVIRWLLKHTNLLVDMSESSEQSPDDFLSKYKLLDPEILTNAGLHGSPPETKKIISVHYERVHDYYNEYDPWVMVIFRLKTKDSNTVPVLIFSFKDGDKEIESGIVSKRLKTPIVKPISD